MHIYNEKYFRGRLKLWLIFTIILLLLCGIVFWQHLPYQNIVSRQIINILKSKNITIASLKVESANSSEIILSNINLEGHPALNVKNLRIKYNIQKLLAGEINDIEAENIDINLYKKDGKLLVGGLEEFLANPTPNKNNKIYTDKDALQKFLPKTILIKNLNISAKDSDIELLLPLNLTFGFNPTATLNMDSPGINLGIKPYHLVTEKIIFNAALNSKKWQGEIITPSVKITGLKTELPEFLTKINFTLDAENLLANIIMNDDKNLIKTNMEVSLPTTNPASGNLNIKQIQFPWGGGIISSKSVNVQLDMKKLIEFDINLQNVDLSKTLGEASKGKIKGTGKISGVFPVIYNPDGTIILKDGMAEEINDGTISVSPDLLPGNNPQLELARTTLENFHYTKLKILVSSKGDKSAINLALEGKNPDSPEERPVKFNINLTGDIMPLIQQSIIPFNDIMKLLKQEK